MARTIPRPEHSEYGQTPVNEESAWVAPDGMYTSASLAPSDDDLICGFIEQYRSSEITVFQAMTGRVIEICRQGLSQLPGSFNTSLKFELFDRNLRDNDGSFRKQGFAKSPESAEATLQRRRAERAEPFRNSEEIYEAMHDLSAMSIALYLPDDMERVDAFIKERFEVQRERQWPKPSNGGPSMDSRLGKVPYPSLKEKQMFSGYAGHHYIVKLRGSDIHPGDPRNFHVNVAEIQVKSLLMFAWQKIHHELVYKPGANIASPIEEDDERMLDISNGTIQASEGILKQLQSNFSKRERELQTVLPTAADMVNYILNASLSKPDLYNATEYPLQTYLLKEELFLALQIAYNAVTPKVLLDVLAKCRQLSEDRIPRFLDGKSSLIPVMMRVLYDTGGFNATLRQLYPSKSSTRTSVYKRARYNMIAICQTVHWLMFLQTKFFSSWKSTSTRSLLPRMSTFPKNQRPKLEHVLAMLHPAISPFDSKTMTFQDVKNIGLFCDAFLSSFRNRDVYKDVLGKLALMLPRINVFWAVDISFYGTDVAEFLPIPPEKWEVEMQDEEVPITPSPTNYRWMTVPAALVDLLDSSSFVTALNKGIFFPKPPEKDKTSNGLGWAHCVISHEESGFSVGLTSQVLRNYVESVDS